MVEEGAGGEIESGDERVRRREEGESEIPRGDEAILQIECGDGVCEKCVAVGSESGNCVREFVAGEMCGGD